MNNRLIKVLCDHVSVETKSAIYAKLDMLRNKFRYFLISPPLLSSKINPKRIPIIINNFNRLTYLQRLIASLEVRGYHNIYIIDNNSTYPPLLKYYKTCPYTVFRLNENIGYKAIWETNIYEQFKRSYYVYTDSDMQIDDNCPDNFMEHFIQILKKYPLSQKVGFGIKIDDLPQCFVHKDKVIRHESQYWMHKVSKGVYRAMIDTTFALYRPFCGTPASPFQETYRTGAPYVIKHLPWYVDSENMDEEETYYLKSIKKPTHWSVVAARETFDIDKL